MTPGPYLVSPSEGRMMTMNTRKKKHLCMVSWFSLDLGKGGKKRTLHSSAARQQAG